MSYVIKSFDRYYINTNEGEPDFIETYSLRMATTFKTKKSATKWIEDNTDWERNTQTIKLTQELLDEYDQWEKTMIRRTMPKMDKTGTWDYDEKKHTPEDVIKFFLEVQRDESRIPYESYCTWPKVYEKFTHLHDITGLVDCINHTQSFTFSIQFPRDQTDYHLFKKELDIALSFSPTSTTRNGGHLFLDVFDYHLCQGGDRVELVVKDYKNDKFDIVGSYITPLLNVSLEMCFDYLRIHRPAPSH